MGRPRKIDEDTAIDRAMDLFWRQGYRGTSPQDLVDAVGMGKGSLYHAFGSKRELFGRALDRYRDQQAILVDEALARPGPVKERIANALVLMVDMNAADPDRRGCLAVNTAAELAGFDEDATDRVRAMFERTTATFLDAIRTAQAAGELRDDLDPEAVATHLLTTLVGLQLLSKARTDPSALKRSIAVALAPL
ncbi:MAG: TetR/AcrR family transcriptional regulator [Salana multivorans]|uniref:TetR/AcrR family transcriptional regulator n=1 Tax=Salana multivorans TaxID=120377 RepID=UPI0009648460|nr:TetR/AcrR family transcriptional regulator [Salana multivorans]MBN8883673.1 TetR/AcrR family transcriptional regulator [Salana multivorans]OJX94676.1 MAG: TetR family transcriptional regulator [Micrococcales bacterium 73-15]